MLRLIHAMHSNEGTQTSMGPVPFAETHWSLVLRARGRSAPLALDALEQLCRTYWYPLYGFVRRQRYDPATAQDLTQEFFARFVHKNCLDHVDRSKGKFRSFLLACLKNFLANQGVRAERRNVAGGIRLSRSTVKKRRIVSMRSHFITRHRKRRLTARGP
jgi:RNA polymerase sigma-70 factor (ECF subfamily)